MPVIEGGKIPAGARDITDDVVKLKNSLNDLFNGEDVVVIGTAVGSLIGESLPNVDSIRELLYLICSTAGEQFAIDNPDIPVPEGVRVQ